MTGIVYATARDAEPFLRQFAERRLEGLGEGETARHDDVLVTITGVGKVKATLWTERLLQSFPVDRLLHVGTCTALADDVEVGTLVAADDVLEGDRVSLSAPSYPRMPLSPPDGLPTGTLVTHDHAANSEEDEGYWQRLADFSDTTGYAIAYVAAQHGIPCQIVKAVTAHFYREQDDFHATLTTAREQLAEFVLEAIRPPEG